MYLINSFSNVQNSIVNVGTSPTKAASPAVISHQRVGRNTLVVYNKSAATVYWGGPNMTSATGIPIAAGATESFCVPVVDSEKSVYLLATTPSDVVIAELFD